MKDCNLACTVKYDQVCNASFDCHAQLMDSLPCFSHFEVVSIMHTQA